MQNIFNTVYDYLMYNSQLTCNAAQRRGTVAMVTCSLIISHTDGGLTIDQISA